MNNTVAWGRDSLFFEVCDVPPANECWQEQYEEVDSQGTPTELDVVRADFVVDCVFNFVIASRGDEMQSRKNRSYDIMIDAHQTASDFLEEAVNLWPEFRAFQSLYIRVSIWK